MTPPVTNPHRAIRPVGGLVALVAVGVLCVLGTGAGAGADLEVIADHDDSPVEVVTDVTEPVHRRGPLAAPAPAVNRTAPPPPAASAGPSAASAGPSAAPLVVGSASPVTPLPPPAPGTTAPLEPSPAPHVPQGTAPPPPQATLPHAPAAPRSWAGRVFMVLHWSAPWTPSAAPAVWSMDHNGNDPRLEERGRVAGHADDRHGVGDFDITGDGSLMAFTQLDPSLEFDVSFTELWVRDVNGNRRHIATAPTYFGPVRFSPEGDRLAVVRGTDLVVMDVDGSNEIVYPALVMGSPNTTPSWSPDGTRIALTTENGLELLEPGTGDRVVLATGLCRPQPEWSPDGTRLAVAAFSGTDAGIHLVDAATGTTTTVYAMPERSGVRCFELPPVRFSSNDTLMFSRSLGLDHVEVAELDLRTGTTRTVFDPGHTPWTRLFVTPR